jgi:hypothetical protein
MQQAAIEPISGVEGVFHANIVTLDRNVASARLSMLRRDVQQGLHVIGSAQAAGMSHDDRSWFNAV